MATLTAAQVYNLAKDAGLSPAAAGIATAIARAESGWRTDAMGDTTITTDKWGPSIGLWQIRSVKAESGTGGTRDATRLTDPAFNARSMVSISSGGTRWSPWSVYTSGAYRQYMGADTSGDGTLPPGTSTTNPNKRAIDSEGVLDKLNPFDNWAEDGLTLGLKLLATGLAGGLVVIGAIRTVSGGSS